MFEGFDQLYCPHCNAVIDKNLRPKRCFVCNGLIAYGRSGTSKGWEWQPHHTIMAKAVFKYSVLGFIALLILNILTEYT